MENVVDEKKFVQHNNRSIDDEKKFVQHNNRSIDAVI